MFVEKQDLNDDDDRASGITACRRISTESVVACSLSCYHDTLQVCVRLDGRAGECLFIAMGSRSAL